MKIDILQTNIFDKNKVLSGVTKANFETFKKGFSLSKGEILSDTEVFENRNALANQLNKKSEQFIFQKQIHSSIIRVVNDYSLTDVVSDAMITNKKNIILNVLLADCLGVLMYDTKEEVVAAVHSGWKGTYKKISIKTIEKMQKFYDSKVENIQIYLSPCAGGNSYEVEYDVAKLFPNNIRQISNSKYLFDNRKQVYDDLIDFGIFENNIEKSDVCTITNKNFHSFRRDKDKSGRMSAFIGMI